MSIHKAIDDFKRKLTFTGKVCRDDVIKLEKDIGCNFISSIVEPRTLSSVPSSVGYQDVLRICANIDSNKNMIARVNDIVCRLNEMIRGYELLDGKNFLGYEDLVFIPTENTYRKFKDLTISELVELSGSLVECLGKSVDPREFEHIRDVNALRMDVSVLIGIIRVVNDINEQNDRNLEYCKDVEFETIFNIERKVHFESEFNLTVDELFFLSKEVLKLWSRLGDIEKSKIVKEFDSFAYFFYDDRDTYFGHYLAQFFNFFYTYFTYKEKKDI